MDQYRGAISLITLIVGLSIFTTIILWKVDTWASNSEANLRLLSANLDRQDQLYSQTMKDIKKGKSF